MMRGNIHTHRNARSLILLGLLATIAVALASCSKETVDATATQDKAAIQTVAAKNGSVSVVVEAPAVVEPYRLQTIRSGIEGVVISSAAEGSQVTKDSVIVRLDPDAQQKAVRQAELALAQARVNRAKAADTLDSTTRDLKNVQALAASGSVPEDQVRSATDTSTAAKRSLDLADIAVSQAQLTLETAQRDLAGTVVRAPFDGVVLSSSLNPGDLVSKGAELLSMGDISRLRLNAEVDEYDIGRVQEGQSVTISSDTLGSDVLRTRVERVSKAAQIVNNIPVFRVYAVLANVNGKLKPGMSADMSILIRSDNGLVVPSSAVSSVRGRSYIKVQNGEQVVTKRVEVGADDGTNVVVLSGIEENDAVVVPNGAASAINLGTTQSSSGTSVVPISIPGTGGTK